jgi:type IV conjugative transfer system coupling protein TraD
MTLSSSPFTQGGQTQLHKIRMLKQVSFSTIKISLMGSLLGWFSYFFSHQGFINILMFPAHWWALMITDLSRYSGRLNDFCFCIIEGRFQQCSASAFLNSRYCATFMYYLYQDAKIACLWAEGAFILTAIGVITYFLKKGGQLKQAKKLSGFELTDLKGYKRFLKKNKIASHLKLESVPIPCEVETKHFMITGTTGSGKSNALYHLLQQLQTRGDRVVIVDTTGSYISRFYQPDQDTILNPYDVRSEKWGLFQEVHTSNDAQEIASILVPKHAHQSDFWSQAARLMLSEGIQAVKRDFQKPMLSQLQSILLQQDFQEIYRYFKGSNIASYFSGKAQETANSIRITLATSMSCLESLADGGKFSLKNWIKNEGQKGWLYLACQPEQRESMKSLLSCWLSLAMKAVMGLGENSNRRIWFIIDELTSLDTLPSLQGALAELRKYGGCMVLGFQNLSQLEALYGSTITSSLSELTGTKFIFQCVDSKIASRMSSLLGQQETVEASENISFGANEIRDGVSLSHHKKLANLIKPTELLQLKPLECYIKTLIGAPVFKTTFSYLDLHPKASSFIPQSIKHKRTNKSLRKKEQTLSQALALEIKEPDQHLPEETGLPNGSI